MLETDNIVFHSNFTELSAKLDEVEMHCTFDGSWSAEIINCTG